MTFRKRAPISELRGEARNLEFLLRDYLDDCDVLNTNPSGTILYFVDAHEIKAFIDPENQANMAGFVLHAEQALPLSEADALQLSLKNDLMLRELLFEQDAQIGLLPSHGQEVDEEIAYRQVHWATEKISLIDRARNELRILRNNPTTRRLLAVAANNSVDPKEKRNVVAFFRRTAPELMSLLRPSPDNSVQRIEALIEQSQLVRLVDIHWEQFGFNAEACSRLRAVRPKPEEVKYWYGHLSGLKERKRNSNRANRIDGEALAYLCALNRELGALRTPRVTARLVTRAMTLIKAGRRADPKLDFLRHPRLMALRRSADTALTDREPARSLIIALHTYRAQLKIEDDSLDREGDQRLSRAIDTLLQAWQQFERSRFTLELRDTVPTTANDSVSVEAEFSALIEWFRTDSDMLKVVQTDLLHAIGHFGEATFALARSDSESPVQARIVDHGTPSRARVLPMVAGAPGPIDFFSPKLRGAQRVSDLEEAMQNLDSNTSERYVAWSLLFACQGRWDLAAVYADSAIAVARLLHSNEATNIADEARLLRAQIQRLSGGGLDSERSKGDGLLRRYHRTIRALSDVTYRRDPRVPREQAAQLLEFCLSVDKRIVGAPSLQDGIGLIHQALDWAQGDDLLRSRILELGLSYHLAVRDQPMLWPERTDADEIVASQWHQELHSILERQRQFLMMDEISRRARALEIIGFQLVSQLSNSNDTEPLSLYAARAKSERPLRVPVSLRPDIGDLRDQLKRSNDCTAGIIQAELDTILRRLYHGRPRDLIYAPIWAAYDVSRIVRLIDDHSLRDLANKAYGMLRTIAGASQHAGIQPDDRPTLQEAAANFARIVDRLLARSADRDLEATTALFYLRMENCYARLLLTRIEREGERLALQKALESDYRAIAKDYPAAAIPHFRLNIILSEMKRRAEAFDELKEALRLVEQDPFLQTPNHWVRSTMQRRLAALLSEEAEHAVDQLRNQPNDKAKEGVLSELLDAFGILYSDWAEPESPEIDYLYQLEARRRINNIVYLASLIFTVDPEGTGLLRLGFDRNKMRSFLERLHGGRIEEVTEPYLVHTIGVASSILKDVPSAVSAGHQLMKLLIETGENPRDDPQIARILSDALAWFASAEGELSFEVGIMSDVRSPDLLNSDAANGFGQ